MTTKKLKGIPMETKKEQELCVKEYLEHLRKHPMPEIMDAECVAALSAIEGQYGELITYGAGLEVRLGEQERYVDYIMDIDEDSMPPLNKLWYEVDYAEYRRAYERNTQIVPCIFANVSHHVDGDDYALFWDKVLPKFLGAKRSAKLRPHLDRITAVLPAGARIKQMGTMTGRGEFDIMRIVVFFPNLDAVMEGLKSFAWPGETESLKSAAAAWVGSNWIGVNLDIDASGVMPKLGLEIVPEWHQPILVDKVIKQFEDAGLCLPEKGTALRRWIRLKPTDSPAIYTDIAYFKLNYREGRIVEAKAYLQQQRPEVARWLRKDAYQSSERGFQNGKHQQKRTDKGAD